MRIQSRLSIALFVAAVSFAAPAYAGGGSAKASGKASASFSIKADVAASGKEQAAIGDAAYAKGDFDYALEAYGEGFAKTRDAAFVYAMAECHKAKGDAAEAKSLFQMYLSAQGSATLKYEADAKAELGMKAESEGQGAVDTVTGIAGKVTKGATDAVAKVEAGVWTAIKVSIAGSIKGSAKAEAKAGDSAYAAGKYEDAAKSYAAAYAKSQQAVALYAGAQANAQAGHAIEARAMLEGYLATRPKGQMAADAKTLLLAVGGAMKEVVKVQVKASASA